MNVAARARYVLDWRDAEGRELSQPLHDGEYLIGRSPECRIVLADPRVSRQHARLKVVGDTIVLTDLGSGNGTFVESQRTESADLRPGDEFRIGAATFRLQAVDDRSESVAISAEGTVIVQPGRLDPDATHVVASLEPEPADEREAVPARILAQPVISEAELESLGVPVTVTEYAAIGGGLGSFVWTDMLRNSGVPASEIAVVGVDDLPHARYERLCDNSQIPRHERLRSNSDSCPDNVWGFPGYAVREAWRELRRGNLRLAGNVLWQIFGEPALSQTYTPRAGDVFRSIERESARIGWSTMLRKGRVRAIRKTQEGRLLAVISISDEHRRRHVAVSSRIMHLGVGYPAIQLLPELAEYRERTNDRRRVVNAYEAHDHVYEDLRKRGGLVVLRGRGIVASRIIQKLYEERAANDEIHIVHLHRSKLTAGHRYGLSRREVDAEFEFQPFNWPKSAWTGQQRVILERADAETRKELLGIWGGTTTADRRDWKRITQEGLRAGWYRPEYGVLRSVDPRDDGRLTLRIANSLVGGGTLELVADYVIDCTGLVASPDRAPLLADMIQTYQLPLNPLGRLAVSDEFELERMRHGDARMYACGAITLGGPLASVDSFLGLQYASFRAVDAARRVGPKALRRLSGLYSLRQWLRWARGATP